MVPEPPLAPLKASIRAEDWVATAAPAPAGSTQAHSESASASSSAIRVAAAIAGCIATRGLGPGSPASWPDGCPTPWTPFPGRLFDASGGLVGAQVGRAARGAGAPQEVGVHGGGPQGPPRGGTSRPQPEVVAAGEAGIGRHVVLASKAVGGGERGV